MCMAKKETAKTEVEPLGAYIARVEREAQPLPVVEIGHPDVDKKYVDGLFYVHQGTYAGIAVGHSTEPYALLSSGQRI